VTAARKPATPKAGSAASRRKPAAPKAKSAAPKAKSAAPKAKSAAPKLAGPPASIPALLAWALRIELDAAERYTELADAMEMHNNREVCALFRKMAVIEGKHAEKVMLQMGWTVPPPLPSGPPPWPGFEAPESAPQDAVHYLMQPWHALELALACEERALRFFGTLAKAVQVPAVKRVALEMEEEEREHVALVKAWMAKVPRPDADWATDPDPPRYLD
jgi:rubrerythrin